jgi:hypothetical protein
MSEMEVLLVRRREGAWHVFAEKHSERDDKRNEPEGLRIDVSSMAPVGSSGTVPRNFKKGDVVVIMDPWWLKYGVLEVGK